MSKLPRDLSGDQLVKGLMRLGYRVVRQTGSHVRLKGGTDGEQPVTVPMHKALKLGTLSSILNDVSAQTAIPEEELLERMKP